jgi:hypothetical protein
MPFGDGPRKYIAMRLGKLTTKIGLALILRLLYYDFERTHK